MSRRTADVTVTCTGLKKKMAPATPSANREPTPMTRLVHRQALWESMDMPSAYATQEAPGWCVEQPPIFRWTLVGVQHTPHEIARAIRKAAPAATPPMSTV